MLAATFGADASFCFFAPSLSLSLSFAGRFFVGGIRGFGGGEEPVSSVSPSWIVAADIAGGVLDGIAREGRSSDSDCVASSEISLALALPLPLSACASRGTGIGEEGGVDFGRRCGNTRRGGGLGDDGGGSDVRPSIDMTELARRGGSFWIESLVKFCDFVIKQYMYPWLKI